MKVTQFLVFIIACKNIVCSEYTEESLWGGIPLISESMRSLVNVSKNMDHLKIQYSEDGLLNFTGLSSKYIRPAEEYDVITEDGYILKLFHIPGNPSNVVLFCPGVILTPDNYLIRGNTSLIYLLAAQGFDVWAMNFRGNRYSRRHVTLNPDTDDRFWRYSVHEIGIYDYKAIVDFVLNKTGQERLSVVAHSEGTAAYFVLTSERPEYNKKIKVFAALSPIAYFQHAGPGLTALFKAAPIILGIWRKFNINEILGYNSFSKRLLDTIGSQGTAGYKLWFSLIGSLTGFNPRNIEPEFLSTIIGHCPAGTGTRNLKHFLHVYRYNRFVKYDYELSNLAIYGTLTPPEYNLKKVTSKVALFAARGDKIVGIEDIERLRMDLPNVVHYHIVSDVHFNHIDYVWGRNAHRVLYRHVIGVLLKYN